MTDPGAAALQLSAEQQQQLQLQQQQQMFSGYQMFNPYTQAAYFQNVDMNSMAFPPTPNFSPEFFQLYMNQSNAQAGIAPAPAAQTTPAAQATPPLATESPSGSMNQTMEGRDSGNETISPQVQQHQNAHTNQNSATTSPQFPANVTPFEQLNMQQQQHIQMQLQQQHQQFMSSPYAINSLLSSSGSLQTSPTNVADDKENETKRRNTMPTPQRRRRPTPYEKLGMASQMANPFVYPQMMMNNLMNSMKPNDDNICHVCGDHASGYHYGVVSCEGCKGFFRRSVHKKVNYVCANEGKCQFTFENCLANRGVRVRCPACRYKRCLFVGMNKENVRAPNDAAAKKPSGSSTEALPPPVADLVTSFQEVMSSRVLLDSATTSHDAIKKFIQKVPALKDLFPQSDDELTALINKLMPGLLTIRAAFSLDNVPFFTSTNAAITATIEKLRAGIRNTILFDEGLAIVSGIHILQVINGGAGEIFDTYCLGLRQHIAATRSQEKGASDRLLTKLGLLL